VQELGYTIKENLPLPEHRCRAKLYAKFDAQITAAKEGGIWYEFDPLYRSVSIKGEVLKLSQEEVEQCMGLGLGKK
jgi:hypothetical protein